VTATKYQADRLDARLAILEQQRATKTDTE